jgi:probable HAF family extracellular repeat protein
MGMRNLGSFGGEYSEASDLNDSGRVVVTALDRLDNYFSVSRSFITGPDGMGMKDLGGVHAHAINNAGQVAGTFQGNFTSNLFITGPNGEGMRDLGGGIGGASHINSAGQITGNYGEPYPQAFITGPNGAGRTVLGTLGGDISIASSINDAGQVVGFSELMPGGERHAFITRPSGGGIRDLGSLGGSSSAAAGINEAGQVVGSASIPSGAPHAFITGPNGEGMTDLNSLVDVPGGIVLTGAVAINNVGQVIAIGVIPEPESYAMFLAGLGLLGFMARRKRSGINGSWLFPDRHSWSCLT